MWEYHVMHFAVDSPAEEELMRGELLPTFGHENWELASIVIRPKTEALQEDIVFCYFKRWITEKRPDEMEAGLP